MQKNKIQIIPAINADSFEEIKEKILQIESVAEQAGIEWVQVDVADGTFAKNTLWHNPKDLEDLQTKLKLEFHLMVSEPEKRISDWLGMGSAFGNGDHGLRRIIFHLAASKDPDFVISRCLDYGKEAGIAIGPDESLVKAIAYKDRVKFFQILSVHPGLPGQEMLPDTFDRIKELRQACPDCDIEVDGGVNLENASHLISSGANILAAASAVFKGDVAENIAELRLRAESV